jgi:hypothetical protein
MTINRHIRLDASQSFDFSHLSPRELADLPPYHPPADDTIPSISKTRHRGFSVRRLWRFGS